MKTVKTSTRNWRIEEKNPSELKNTVTEVKSTVSSVFQSCPSLCDPMDCSIPGFLIHHHLLELAQTHAH